ncbi:winged helix-turn-helix transcriptional regulator [Alteromonas lipolytica]|uniref:HxlR family transcriptional regulator n=1 Tax=Alteromonas lipolytica TaxID=1856405 RepID=A0A1E8F896_9ALTE|nr:helix-turn-helix domain-containing protein [Alteromonas lipolytica]OFI32134.1 HxlR family transcriptional regulator [Alteromonas lipolytica]
MNNVKKALEELTLTEKFRQGNVRLNACPSRNVLKDVTSRWGVLVFLTLQQGTHRYSELRHKINGVSEKMLTQTLHALEEDGFVLRTAHPVIPPHVEYSLTESGKEVAVRVEELVNWIEVNINSILTAKDEYAAAHNEAG